MNILSDRTRRHRAMAAIYGFITLAVAVLFSFRELTEETFRMIVVVLLISLVGVLHDLVAATIQRRPSGKWKTVKRGDDSITEGTFE